ncbi:MAG: hypothetical protein VX320_05795, partial [Candidatus Thermoplasmatota archaeon]|nr:hypothetical protein [Candidatus Thermoplasmatota archaeon]MEE3083576.1 hypothetical protein [Candidatus Thermoplasmatota archaeon]
MASGALVERRSLHLIIGVILVLIGQSFSPMVFDEKLATSETSARDGEIWDSGVATWAQFGKNPSRNATVPAHAPSDQMGIGEYASITDPVLNWNHYDENDYGVDTLGVSVANFSGNIDTGGMVLDSCARDSLSPVFIHNKEIGGDKHGIMRIVDGDTSSTMWQVDLGVIDEDMKATPAILDVNGDGALEIVVVYDANDQATVEMWTPIIECDVTSWKPGGSHETERLWRWTHDTFRLSADRVNGCWSCPKPVSQPLLADLLLDGTPELVLTLYDDINDEPNIVALPLPDTGGPSPMWEVTLDKGTHASDPAWTQIDAVSAAILLTTISEVDGNMWVWRLDSSSGQIQYDDTLQNTDGDTDVPHVRLPGPIITQLDSDPAPEMVIVIPTDIDQSGTSDGAEFIGLNVIDASEIFSFEATNGYADAPPVLIDSDENGITDRICWNTWYRDGTSWHGVVGCHDYLESTQSIQHDWTQYIEGAATLNDEIAVSAPTAMDIDGAGKPEIIVTYGRNLFAHDGDTGSRASINAEWVAGLELPHRTWASHTLADFEGDGTLDLLVGDMLISTAGADVRPFEDGLAITFLPSTPDPGQNVEVTGWFENVGTASTNLDTFARMYVDDELVYTHREGALDPVEPTGNGNDGTFTFDWSGGLGNHTFTLRIDEHGNLSQTRTDNDNATTVLTILAPYNVSIGVPNDPVRVLPGGQQDVMPLITSTGRLSGTWTMNIDDSGLPNNWTVDDMTPSGSSGIEIGVGATWSPTLRISAPSEALGTDSGFIVLTMTLDSDENVTQTAILPIEAERTRGLSVRGPAGTNVSTGFGIPGQDAAAWILIENLGNAPENVELSWDSTAWGSDLRLYDNSNTQVIPLTLQPSQTRELTARLPVDVSTALGNSVTTPLTLCIGTENVDQECSTIQLTFVANNVQILPPHIRSVPADDLVWNVEVQLPASVSELEWDMASAGMIMSGWTWSSTGALSIDGTTLRANGNVGGRITGTLELDMPYAPPPMLHQWNSEEANESGHTLALSLQVLQKYRAVAEITFPTSETHRMDVNVQETMILRLENTGNGPDVYDISWHIVENVNFSSDPGLTVSIPSSQYAIGAGELRSIPIAVTLPEDMPAAEGLILAFEMRSQGDLEVYSVDSIIVEARQDHQWQMVLQYQENNLTNGATIDVDPGENIALTLHVTNTGNLEDEIVLTPSISVQTAGLDSGDGWSAMGGGSNSVAVNATSSVPLMVNVSSTAWKGSVATISFDGMSDDTSIPAFIIHIDVKHVPGWWILAGGADLDIDRNGENVTLIVEQRGNDPASPYINGWVNVNGWEINLSQDLPVLNPGEQANFTCEIIPPAGAISGHTVELTLSARNNDGSGEGQTTLPLRVASWHDYSLTHENEWTISQYGGMPLAMLTNLGNAPTSI